MKNELLLWVLAVICVAFWIVIIILLATYYFAGAIILVSIAIWITKRVIEKEFFNN
jgi:uncharacterized membrane protein